ncbi:hypothetical protein Glove_172g45 [Diversispora epigaea]|uniref:Uncharacterized protein n=1 Tax=Diversispora epigaea TaxID=1348612 RepID=A0A397IYU5_9GLOM|nr:hypothetical protein Glove_172g45 [Diversispora epigaea]
MSLEIHEILIELFNFESIYLTENIKDSKPFDDRNGTFYPVVPEMSFNNWTNLDNLKITGWSKTLSL